MRKNNKIYMNNGIQQRESYQTIINQSLIKRSESLFYFIYQYYQVLYCCIEKMQKQLTALIYGSTGAVGCQLVNFLLNSSKWVKIIVVVRNRLPEWQNHPNKRKLEVQVLKNMDQLFQPSKFKYQNVDVVFCALGTQVKFGQETFIKVDKTYPLMAADIALRNNIPHYILVSSMGASSSSCLLYPRIKGQVQAELRAKKLDLLTIFRPGLLANRTNARFGQKIVSVLCGCCIPEIQAKDCAQVLMIVAEREVQNRKNHKQTLQLYQNRQMLEIFQQRLI